MARIDPDDPLFRPLTIAEAAEITNRSQRTIRRWVRERRLTAYEVQNPPETVLIERDVVEVDKANRDAFAAGRPRRDPDSSGGAKLTT